MCACDEMVPGLGEVSCAKEARWERNGYILVTAVGSWRWELYGASARAEAGIWWRSSRKNSPDIRPKAIPHVPAPPLLPPKNEHQGGGSSTILKGQEPPKANDEETKRRLGIPEFNLKEPSPANWGLERISTRGSRNGKYIWVSEGWGTDIYIFDTGIHDSEEFTGRPLDFGVPSDSRVNSTFVCAGQEGDEGEHGSFLASIIGGKRYGVGRSAAIHPMQILDLNGEGTLATFLCGMDKLIQDGIDYFAANAPYKMKGVVNLSVGTNGKSDIFDKAAEDFVNAGYTVVIAAGDFGGNACHYSPTTPGAIRVGALKDRGLLAGADNDKTDDSNYGKCGLSVLDCRHYQSVCSL